MVLRTLLLSWSQCNQDLINNWETILGVRIWQMSLHTVVCSPVLVPSVCAEIACRMRMARITSSNYCLTACPTQLSAKSCNTTRLVKSLVENPHHGICTLQLSAVLAAAAERHCWLLCPHDSPSMVCTVTSLGFTHVPESDPAI